MEKRKGMEWKKYQEIKALNMKGKESNGRYEQKGRSGNSSSEGRTNRERKEGRKGERKRWNGLGRNTKKQRDGI
jgi:hypothetical protein